MISQNRKDLPRDIPIDRLEVLRFRRWWRDLFPTESDSLPHAHTQDLKFQVIKKAQDKDFCYSDDQYLP
ncbi:hypothetical protein Tco_1370237 [Tanacetum coccineum]